MLLGEYYHTIDTKGRLIVPAKLREDLGDKFIVAKAFDECLNIYTSEAWMKFVEKLSTLPEGKSETRRLVRFLLSSAFEVEVDKQGRILIPQKHREYAKIDKEVVLAGAISKVEIWSRDKWEQNNLTSEQASEIVEGIYDLGINF